MKYVQEEFLWVEKYRPHKICDTVLPIELKSTFKKFVEQNKIPNLILAGSAGVGKTTVARAMLDEIGADHYMINGSLNGTMDTLRNDIQSYASTLSLTGGRKYVILDEADHLSHHMQPALRNFMEEFSRNCGFILTCNFLNKIIEPLQSRCSVIKFTISKSDMPKLAAQFMKRAVGILDQENIKYDKAVVAHLIEKYFPDWRRVLNEMQRYSVNGSIDSGILANARETSINELIGLMRDKNFTEVRKWVYNNQDNDIGGLYRQFYDLSKDYFKPGYIPHLVILLAKYQYQQSFCADHEINFSAFLAELMIDGEFN